MISVLSLLPKKLKIMASKKIKPKFKKLDNNSISPDALKSITETTNQDLQTEELKQKENVGLFKMKLANEWLNDAKNKPIPKMLFSELWHEGEVCILFSDSNLGKSILAVQIADAITKGRYDIGFKMEADAQTVLYFDFEMSDKQFEKRYSIDYTKHYEFKNNFFRIEIDTDAELPPINPKEPDGKKMNYQDFLNQSIENAIQESKAKILIIDNITYLNDQIEAAKDALPLMKALKKLAKKYSLSMLVLAHTPKRDMSSRINQNHLSGSKMLFNFCDACFAIGKNGKEKDLRYIKQIKARNTGYVYGETNVITCEIKKPDNFLMLEFKEFNYETEHLVELTDNDRKKRKENGIELIKQGNLNNTQIANQLGATEGAVRKWKKEIEKDSNKIELESNDSSENEDDESLPF